MIKSISSTILGLTLLFTLVQNSTAQQPVIEYGSSADLKEVKRIFVYTGSDVKLRNNIVKEITKNLKHITITNAPSEAQVCLVYGTDFLTFYAGTSTNSTVTVDRPDSGRVETQSTPQYRMVTYGSGSVVIIKPDNNTVRIIMNFEDSKGGNPPLATLFERDPSTNFARAFVKAYKEANKEEKKK